MIDSIMKLLEIENLPTAGFCSICGEYDEVTQVDGEPVCQFCIENRIDENNMDKSILAVQELDEELKVTCRKCGQEMEQVDLGVSQSIQNGQLVESDLGFVWHCPTCGYTCDGEG